MIFSIISYQQSALPDPLTNSYNLTLSLSSAKLFFYVSLKPVFKIQLPAAVIDDC